MSLTPNDIQIIKSLLAESESRLEARINFSSNDLEKKLKKEIKILDRKVTHIETSFKKEIKVLDNKLTTVETSLIKEIKVLDNKLTTVETNLKEEMRALHKEVRSDISLLKIYLDTNLKQVENRLKNVETFSLLEDK